MNLSSSEDEGYSSNDDDIASILHHQKETNTTILASATEVQPTTVRGTECSDDNSDVSEDIDWEDASVGESEASEVPAPISQDTTEKARRRAFPARDVVIHFDDDSKDGKTRDNQGSQKKGKLVKNRRMKKIKRVPLHMQNLLRDLHRSHMLCAISRAIHLSSNLGSMENELWSVAYSSIPAEFMSDENISSNFALKGSSIIPSYRILKNFSLWFFDYVSNVEIRRQRIHMSNVAAGAPRTRRSKSQSANRKSAKMSLNKNSVNSSIFVESQQWGQRLLDMLSYLSPLNDADPQSESRMTFAALDKILLFCVMTRSLRWRVRFVTSLDPMKQDLTVEHPLFSTTIKNTFQSIVKSIEKGSKSKRKKRKRGKESAHEAPHVDLPIALHTDECYQDFVWAEVLCSKPVKQNNASDKHSRWTHIDPSYQLFDQPMTVELIDTTSVTLRKSKKVLKNVSYVIGIEHFHDIPNDTPVLSTTRIVDISPRYSNKWSETLRLRGANAKEIANGKCSNRWWSRTIKKVNTYFVEQRAALGLSDICMDKKVTALRPRQSKSSPIKVEQQKMNGKDIDVLILDDSSDDKEKSHEEIEDDSDDLEQQEFASSKEKEAIPTSKASFKNHPLYIIPSVLKSQEVIAPDAKKRICGIFKGEMVYKRSDASKALIAHKWLYQGRKVKENELKKPAKIVKARKKPMKKGFQALSSYGTTTESQAENLKNNSLEPEDDGKNKLYGIWQTKKWSPAYIAPNDAIPVNEFKNVELALLNPGLVHLELYRIAQVAKRLGVPYAPCLLGFEGHGGNMTPTIRGIVVHTHNSDLLREAHVEMQSMLVENEYKEKQREIYGKWKRLIKGVLTKERLEREYAND